MLVTQAPKYEGLSLYEYLKLTGHEDCDIGDEIWDLGTNLGYGGYDSFEEIDKAFKDPNDRWYFKLILLFCWNIKVVKPQPNWYTVCDVCGFIEANKEAWDQFLNEENREGYRPMDYKHLDPNKDDGYFEVYMQSFEQLCIGNYSDRQYGKLFLLLLNNQK